jgi:hypothetical protein
MVSITAGPIVNPEIASNLLSAITLSKIFYSFKMTLFNASIYLGSVNLPFALNE